MSNQPTVPPIARPASTSVSQWRSAVTRSAAVAAASVEPTAHGIARASGLVPHACRLTEYAQVKPAPVAASAECPETKLAKRSAPRQVASEGAFGPHSRVKGRARPAASLIDSESMSERPKASTKSVAMSQLSSQSPVRYCWTPIDRTGRTARLETRVMSLARSARRRAPGFLRRKSLRALSSKEFTADHRWPALPPRLTAPPISAKATPL